LKLQITVEGKAYEVDVEVLEEDESPWHSGYGQHHPAPAPQPMPAPGLYGHAADGNGEEEKVCLSPVTGLVIKVIVEPGQMVEPNQLIMVLEAMKMETNVMAHRAAKVKSVHVTPGDSVKVNQVLVEFE
jgi:methylmalonyl-CoA carboxyltransferase small subunit